MDLGAILLALLTGLVVKTAVMVVSAWLVVKLYRATWSPPPRRLWILLPEGARPEARVLWWALLFFFVAELTCGIEIYILFESSGIMSGTHAIASGVGMGLFSLGLLMFVDDKIIGYAGTRCAVNRICRGCTIARPDGCKMRLLLMLGATLLVMAALFVFFMPTARMNADMSRYTLPFESLNAWFDGTVDPWLRAHFADYQPSGTAYFLPESMLVLEFRILPSVAAVCAVVGIALLRGRREVVGLRWVAFAAGLVAYVYFEVALYPATGDVLIGSLGHEVAELWFLLATVELLRRSFPAPVEA